MPFDSKKHHRRSVRLKHYDYSSNGAYFVTVCTNHRECLLGEIIDSKIVVNLAGKMVEDCWHDLPNYYKNIELDYFVIMPNHIHGILILSDANIVGAGLKPAPTVNDELPEIVRALKTFSARRINESRNTLGTPFWQRNYYEHVIRNEESLGKIREYIQSNPLKWELDQYHPKKVLAR
jgi:REP element-mobilizing transposase RayT